MQDDEIIFDRPIEIKELIDSIGNHKIKVVVGLRRSGKSYLLNSLFKSKLIENGVLDEEIKPIDLQGNYDFVRSPSSFKDVLNSTAKDNVKFLFVDEIQLVGEGYEDVLISFCKNNPGIDVFITGSNSKTLSDDIRKAFKEHASIIRIRPIAYKEIIKVLPTYSIDDYFKTGSLPIVLKEGPEGRVKLLEDLYHDTYLIDIQERLKTKYLSNQEKENIIERILTNMMNPIGELKICKGIINHRHISEEAKAELKREILDFIGVASSSFLICDFDNGKQYDESTPEDYVDHDIKKYCFDNGLLSLIHKGTINKKNSALLENIVYLELLSRGIEPKGTYILKENGEYGEIDFYFRKDGIETYIQVEHTLDASNRDREIGNLELLPKNANKMNVYVNNLLDEKGPSDIKTFSLENFALLY